MIIEEIRAITSGRSELRKFGILIGVVLGLLALWWLWRGKEGGYALLMGAAALLAVGLTMPRLLKPLYLPWMTLAVLLGWLMTRVILILLFYLVVTPLGLLARLCGTVFLTADFDRTAQSYWIARKDVPADRTRYENQF